MQKNRKKGLLLGLLGGILLPILFFLVLYLIKFKHYELSYFIERLLAMKIASNFVQLSAIPNLALFFILMRLNKMYAARGVIGSTFLLAIIVLILMF